MNIAEQTGLTRDKRALLEVAATADLPWLHRPAEDAAGDPLVTSGLRRISMGPVELRITSDYELTLARNSEGFLSPEAIGAHSVDDRNKLTFGASSTSPVRDTRVYAEPGRSFTPHDPERINQVHGLVGRYLVQEAQRHTLIRVRAIAELLGLEAERIGGRFEVLTTAGLEHGTILEGAALIEQMVNEADHELPQKLGKTAQDLVDLGVRWVIQDGAYDDEFSLRPSHTLKNGLQTDVAVSLSWRYHLPV